MRFGPFEIVRPLGRGGMAETFLALWPGHEGFARQICLKRVLAERSAEPDFVRSFQREAKLAARLLHPHIAQVYEFGCEGETWWMALEHVPGGDLRALFKALGQPMPVDLGLVLMVDMLEALAYAHELGIVHRDVSPSNILVDLQGNFKLVDFGIAKVRHVDRDGTTAFSTTTGTIKGKAAYMAPEQALGLEVDGRADLWSFGVVMFEAFASAKPFDGTTDLAMMMAASQGRRARLVEVAPHVPPPVCEVIERLLSPDRDQRFQSAHDVLEALTDWPAPVQGRRRLSAMLLAIGATAPDTSDAQRTVLDPPRDPTPSQPAPAEGAVALASSEPVIAPARRSAPPLSPSTMLTIVAVFLGAVGVGVAVVLAIGPRLAGSREAPTSTSTPAAEAPPEPLVTTPTTGASAGDPPVARGVLVPDESELPMLPETPAAGVRATARGPRTSSPVERPPHAPTVADGRGSLHVTVIPWGDVTVDGTRYGRSPVTIPLPAGSHRVRIDSESGSRTQDVQLAPGEREELEIDLTGT